MDKAQLRADVGMYFADEDTEGLWLDFGNGQHTGQYVLGHIGGESDHPLLLPNVWRLFPELDGMADDDTPSCSFEEAIMSQDLMVNSVLADQGINLLWQLLRHGKITHHGGFVRAVAYRRYSRDYVAAEQRARRQAVGIWAGEFVMPWDWRRGKRLADSTVTAHNEERDCGDIRCQIEAQHFLEAHQPRDPRRQNGDAGGVACESLPWRVI